jgi:hypothetical protein
MKWPDFPETAFENLKYRSDRTGLLIKCGRFLGQGGVPSIVVPLPWSRTGAAGSSGRTRFPAGFNPQPAPYGVGFTGTACNEPRLLGIAYAFEQGRISDSGG